MIKKIINIIILIGIFGISYLLADQCPPLDTLSIYSNQNNWNFPNENKWNQVEIMTWNLKEFPYSNSTVNNVQEVISDMLPDIVAFQEINDDWALNDLANDLFAYEFVSSGSGLALAVRKDVINIIDYTTLFPDFGYEFAWRFPFKVELEWNCGSTSSLLSIIVVHLKAYDGEENFDRRYSSCEELSTYVNLHPTDKIIILGDFNDEITDPEYENSLWPLISNSSISFVTMPIANEENSASYPSWPSFIDHIAINAPLFDESNVGSIKTIRVDDYTGYTFYQNNFSDHRPVIWSFTFQNILDEEVPEGIVINEIMKDPLTVSDADGEWLELTNISNEDIDLNGFIISDNSDDWHLIDQDEGLIIHSGGYLVLGINAESSLNGGVHIDYQYANFFLSNNWDEVILYHPSGIILDEVLYDNGETFPDIPGASMALISPSHDGSLGENWISSTSLYSLGDYGTPNESNDYEELLQITSSYNIPQEFVLYQNYPNPFNPTTIIQFDVLYSTKIVLLVYDIVGKEINVLIDKYYTPGNYSASWDAIDSNGLTVPGGLYLLELRSNHSQCVKKIIYLK